MNVQTRQTAAGTEYWDTKEKRVRFVPAGKKPDFEVTENPKSMVGEKGDPDKEGSAFDDMTVKQLRAYAEERDIEIPKDVTKRDDIIQFLSNEEK